MEGGRMTGAVLISWGQPARGREAKGLEVFMKAMGYYEGLAKSGRIHGHKEFIAQTGDVGTNAGFMLIEGNLDELYKIQAETETRKLLAQAQAIVDHFTVQVFSGGSDRAVQETVSTYVESVQELGYM
jgi:VCBS repeat-containing protein